MSATALWQHPEVHSRDGGHHWAIQDHVGRERGVRHTLSRLCQARLPGMNFICQQYWHSLITRFMLGALFKPPAIWTLDRDNHHHRSSDNRGSRRVNGRGEAQGRDEEAQWRFPGHCDVRLICISTPGNTLFYPQDRWPGHGCVPVALCGDLPPVYKWRLSPQHLVQHDWRQGGGGAIGLEDQWSLINTTQVW